MYFPQYRPRRMRQSATFRDFIRETSLDASRLIYPLLVTHGADMKVAVPSMPGIHRFSINRLVEEAHEVAELGIGSALLFGIPAHRDEAASEAYDSEGVVQLAVRALHDQVPELTVIADVCLCGYMSHGQCGVVRDGFVDNDLTLELLAKTSVSLAEAGVDALVPSDMMDGRISAIRSALDQEGFINLPIISCSTKYDSYLYAPFREALDLAVPAPDRDTYQLDPANADEGVREALMDIEEGADMIMVKPALGYLDLVWRMKAEGRFPVAAFNESGEYAMVKAAAERGWIDERGTVLELLLGIRRAGADAIITYHAKEAARWLK
jgi:porphobilinogen synthase